MQQIYILLAAALHCQSLKASGCQPVNWNSRLIEGC